MEFTARVITLGQAGNRVGQVNKLIANCPIACSAWDAVDGSQLSPSERSEAYRPRIHAPAYPFALSPGEIGCFFSHREIWRSMVEQSLPQVLILEDDVQLMPDFADTLLFASRTAGTRDYIQFQVRDIHARGRIVAAQGHWDLLRPEVIPLRTSAQLVTLGAAENLVRCTDTFDRPVDAFLQMDWLHGVRILVARPRCVSEISASLGGSTIGVRKRKWLSLGVLTRQCKRAAYRHRIALLSGRNAA